MTDQPSQDAGDRTNTADNSERRRRREQANAPSLAELLLGIPKDGQEFERLNCPSDLRMSFTGQESEDD